MDERPQTDGNCLPLQGPHRPLQHVEPLPPDFQPLRLVLLQGGMVIEMIRPDMTVGRHSDTDIRLPLPDVSRRHCRFVFGNGHWVVMDLNSLNGIYVNDVPVGQATLQQGDRVRIGGYIFAVDLSSELQPMLDANDEPQLAQRLFHTRRVPTTLTHQRRAS